MMEQLSKLLQVVDDHLICFVIAHPCVLACRLREYSATVDRRYYTEFVLVADLKILETMAGSGVHAAGAGVVCDMLSENDQACALDKWMKALDALEFRAPDGSQ